MSSHNNGCAPEGWRTSFDDVHYVEHQSSARSLAAVSPSALVIVKRAGLMRSIVFQCPSGCRDVLTINVDRFAGLAWRLRVRNGRVTVMPSIWRTSGCYAHFVLWENQIWWCQRWREPGAWEEDPSWPPAMVSELREEWRKIWEGRDRVRRRPKRSADQ